MKLLTIVITLALLLLKSICNAEGDHIHSDEQSFDKTHQDIIKQPTRKHPMQLKSKSSYEALGNHGHSLFKRYTACHHEGLGVQSPIDLTHDQTVYNEIPFTFQNYRLNSSSSESHLIMKNIGSGLRIYSELTANDDNMILYGGQLPGKFRFCHIDFHWGSTSEQGSEHHIEGKAYPIEIQIVHHSTNYLNMADALSSDDSDSNKSVRFAVFSILFDTSPSGSGRSIDSMLNALKKIKRAGDRTDLGSLDLEIPLLKESRYYQYNGSLTSPPCTQGVMWFVFISRVNISEKLLGQFRELFYSNGTQLVNNFRPIQMRNNRTIVLYIYNQDKVSNDVMHQNHSPLFTISIIGVIIIFVSIGIGILTVFCSRRLFRRFSRRSTTFQELSHEISVMRNSSKRKSKPESMKNTMAQEPSFDSESKVPVQSSKAGSGYNLSSKLTSTLSSRDSK